MENQPPRSTSGISISRPERGGHSSWQRLLTRSPGSQSPSKAHAGVRTLPPDCTPPRPVRRKSPGACKARLLWKLPYGGFERRITAPYSPLEIDHAPRSFFAQNGPPGRTNKISSRRWRRRYISSPALCFAMKRLYLAPVRGGQPILMPCSPMTANTPMRFVTPRSCRTCLPKIDKFQTAARRAGRNLEANQRAQAHAVYADKIGQVEHDSLAIREKPADPVIENIVHARHQLTVAMDHGRGTGADNFKRKCTHNCFVRHRHHLVGPAGLGWKRYRLILAYRGGGLKPLIRPQTCLNWGFRQAHF